MPSHNKSTNLNPLAVINDDDPNLIYYHEKQCLKYLGRLEQIILTKHPHLEVPLRIYSFPIAVLNIPDIDPFASEYMQRKLRALQNERILMNAELERKMRASNEAIINKTLRNHSDPFHAFQQYKVVNNAKEILHEQGFDAYKKYLFDHKHILLKKPDHEFMLILKGIGVFAAGVLGFGVGGYFAYQYFFKKPSIGEKFLKKALAESKPFKPK